MPCPRRYQIEGDEVSLNYLVDGIVKSKSLRSASEELTGIQLRHSFESHAESSDADGRARCTFVTLLSFIFADSDSSKNFLDRSSQRLCRPFRYVWDSHTCSSDPLKKPICDIIQEMSRIIAGSSHRFPSLWFPIYNPRHVSPCAFWCSH